jgi:hypothetical protein
MMRDRRAWGVAAAGIVLQAALALGGCSGAAGGADAIVDPEIGTSDGGEVAPEPEPPRDRDAPDDAGGAAPEPDGKPSYRDAVLASDPLAYYRFEETGGRIAKDEKGAHDAIWDGAPVLGADGALEGSRAVAFPKDRAARLAIPGDVMRFAGNAAYAFEAWVRPTRFRDYQWIAGTSAPRLGWSILADAEGAIHYEVWDGAVAEPRAVRYLVPRERKLVAGKYQHVVVSYDGARASFWLDGVRIRDDAWMSPAPDVGALLLGCRDSGAAGMQHCLEDWRIDEVAIYAHALAEGDVAKHVAAAARP